MLNRAFILFLLPMTFISLLVQSASAQTITLGEPQFNGSGCSNDTARAAMTADGRQLSIIFDSLISEAGGGTGRRTDRKNCEVRIPVSVPAGYSVSVVSIDYRGFVFLPSQAMAKFSAGYSLAGRSGPSYAKDFVGPMNDNFFFRSESAASQYAWTSCGAGTEMRLSLNLTSFTNQQGEQVTASVDTADMTSGVVYNLQYRRCNGSEPASPYEPSPSPSNPSNPKPPTNPGAPPAPTAPPDQSITGWVDGFQDLGDQGVVLNGWACAKGISSSIDVHVYLNDRAGRGQFIKGARADVGNEPAVSQQCQTSHNAYRFSIPFTQYELRQYSNRDVYVHGISPVGKENSLIKNSGKVKFPRVNDEVKGKVLSIQSDGQGGNIINGMVCTLGITDMRLYAGGAVGSGRLIASQMSTTEYTDVDLQRECGFHLTAAYFVIRVDSATALQFNGQKIWVYALNPSSQELNLLGPGGFYALGPIRDGW